ncbi:serine/threonine-protein phosphatase 4 regulatory subunit 2 [Dorcoceras hygrometricum]|uniref:Serine/threonine-protein phosphatase 4 regulatory subunit 2 n=1 Tax=Dorcoceras hygrometricum TaxID=472368 RepID=A0A2Z7C588_9LAMI|nr:serine/threonine-protein phosphatase 4 regulatory subunit 2 [Dorcoceras hygrometricum]
MITPQNLDVSAPDDAVQNYNDSVSNLSNHVRAVETLQFSEEEVRCALETSASTGRFWYAFCRFALILLDS